MVGQAADAASEAQDESDVKDLPIRTVSFDPETTKTERDSPADENAGAELQEPTAPKKKNKKKKPKSKRGINKPTGFEEFYVDAPVTPAEFEEEKSLYAKTIPFASRLETAIQRYQGKRRMEEKRRNYFIKYLSFGGVNADPRQFGGMDKKLFENMDKDEILAATATSTISNDKLNIGKDNSLWAVDFEGVAASYFSTQVPLFFPLDTEQEVNDITYTVLNFLNYILHHDVCPEYRDDIDRARTLCHQATSELWKVRLAHKFLPGDFNIACSTLFGGDYQDSFDPNATWAEDQLDDDHGIYTGMSDTHARNIVRFGIIATGTDSQAVRFKELADDNALSSKSLVQNAGFEVTELIRCPEEVKQFYRDNVTDARPCGKLRARKWHNPTLPDEDLSPAEQAILATKDTPTSPYPPLRSHYDYEFYVEDAVLELLFIGMKIEADIRELNCGLIYLDRIIDIHPSFHKFLANERMIGWKDPGGAGSEDEAFSEDEGNEGFSRHPERLGTSEDIPATAAGDGNEEAAEDAPYTGPRVNWESEI